MSALDGVNMDTIKQPKTPEALGTKANKIGINPDNVPTQQAKQLTGAFKIPDAHKSHISTPQSGLKKASPAPASSTETQYGESNVTISPDSKINGNTGIKIGNK